MNRNETWEIDLYRYIERVRYHAHEYGAHDCATFAADCIEIMTGEDLMRGFRGRYSDANGVLRLLVEEDVKSLADMLKKIGLEECDIPFVRRGDIVVSRNDEGLEFIGVVQGTSVVSPGATQLVHVPVRQAERAFRVG